MRFPLFPSSSWEHKGPNGKPSRNLDKRYDGGDVDRDAVPYGLPTLAEWVFLSAKKMSADRQAV
jgi:hypothetical protein